MARLPIVSFLFLFGAVGCGILDSDPFAEQQRRLDRATALWAAHGPTSYRMVYQRLCFCPGEVIQPVEIVIREGEVEARSFAETGEPVPEALADVFLPVPRIFEEVQEAIRQRVAELRVIYDPVLGFPLEVFIDHRAEVADDEVSHLVLELTPIP